jgi:hypothetical protein
VSPDVDDDQGEDQGGARGAGGGASMSVSVDEGEDGGVGSGPTPPSAIRKTPSPRLNALDKVGCVCVYVCGGG